MRPFSDAIIGAVAVNRPMQKMAQKMARLCPNAPAANSRGPSQPSRMTSVTPMRLKRRVDAVTDGDQQDKIRANAPDFREGFFAVPKVVE